MQREVLLWPVGKQAQALLYCDAADAAYAVMTNDPNDTIFAYRDRVDRNNQPVTPYFGPTGMGDEDNPGPVEPPACLAARADAVLVTTVDWPEEI